MLRSVRSLVGSHIHASDGQLGRLKDVLFDDASFSIRYLLVDTGRWLPGKQVLLSPQCVVDLDWRDRAVVVNLTRRQVEESPDLRTDLPVSRQHEEELARYYQWAPYWMPGGGLFAGSAGAPFITRPSRPKGDPHLRAAHDVRGYEIRARDERIGHVDDFIADSDGWSIRYLVVDTGSWLPGRKVLLAPAWVVRVDWLEGQVGVDLTADEIRHSPGYDPAAPVNREYEAVLHDYYGRPAYWK